MISFNIEFVQPPRSGINGRVCYVNVSDFNITDSFVSFTTNGEQVFIPSRNVISIDVVEPKAFQNQIVNDKIAQEIMPFCREN